MSDDVREVHDVALNGSGPVDGRGGVISAGAGVREARHEGGPR